MGTKNGVQVETQRSQTESELLIRRQGRPPADSRGKLRAAPGPHPSGPGKSTLASARPQVGLPPGASWYCAALVFTQGRSGQRAVPSDASNSNTDRMHTGSMSLSLPQGPAERRFNAKCQNRCALGATLIIYSPEETQ